MFFGLQNPNFMKRSTAGVLSNHTVKEHGKKPLGSLKTGKVYLEQIVAIQQRLLDFQGISFDYHPVLQELGEATKSDQVYIVCNQQDNKGSFWMKTLAMWTAGENGEKPSNDLFNNKVYRPALTKWKNTLAEGIILQSSSGEFTPSEKSFFKGCNVQYIVMVPILVKSEFFGFLAFLHSNKPLMDETQINLLRILACAVASFELSRQNRQKLQSKQQELNIIADNSTGYILKIDKSGKILDNIKTTTGSEASKFTGKNILDFLDYPQRKMLKEKLSDVFDRGNTVSYEITRQVDGKPSNHFFSTVSPFFDDGVIREAIVIAQDFAESKKTEEALKESEYRHRIVSLLTSDFVYAVSVDAEGEGKSHGPNGVFEILSGYSVEEINQMENGWLTIVHPDDFVPLLSGSDANFKSSMAPVQRIPHHHQNRGNQVGSR